MPSPFPGMDPYLENPALWPGLHQLVIARALADLNRALPPHYVASMNERVYVVKADRTVELRRVTIDRQQGDTTVIADGLKGGEEVVTEGQLRLAPGASVTTGGRRARTS